MGQRDTSVVMLATVLALSGCLGSDTGVGALAGGTRSAAGPAAPVQVQVMSKGFTIAGPAGFCIDESATRETAQGAFVLLGSCSAISGNPDDSKPSQPAVLTASIAPAAAALDAPALDRLAAFFATETGRTALSRAEGGGPVEVLDLDREPGLVMVHASDGTGGGQLADQYWRGVFEAGGQLVTVTVSGFRSDQLDAETGRDLARDFVAATRAANGATAGAPDADATAGLRGFFNRLL